MKTNHAKKSKKGGKPNSRRRGVALVTVLTIMSLATIMIMTFFLLAQNEHNASTNYSDGLQAQQVAEEAVNLVIRQIRKATSNRGLPSGQTLAWASQPGAIRTWNLDGQFYGGFKLYSDDELVVKEEQRLVTEDISEMSTWDTKPWAYVDLNEPVIRGKRVYYPIVDPIVAELPEWKHDLGGDQDGIEGFSYDISGIPRGPMENAVESVPFDSGDGKQVKRTVLPMPAMWIYQLKDGTLGYLDQSKSFQPLIAGGEQPERENPIVARFAYWADDETCKLNPNVHAGGASWATPMAGGEIDRNLGRFQPTQHEWQRYPGHPATTHLAPVIAPGITDITYQRDNMEMIFDLVPRVVGGGSWSGTANVDLNDPKERNGLIADKERLYPSLDEFIMLPDRKPNRFPEPGSRGRAQEVRYMQDQIERWRFFLSVVSRAPETTVFNTPRISIWPTQWEEAEDFVETTPLQRGHHTPFDRLIRFCAELGKNPSGIDEDDRYEYHFQRANADSATFDVYEIERNQELLAYLEKLTRTPIPGANGSFKDKYPREERLQLLTQVFDYIRSTNLHDDTLYQDDWKDAFKVDNSSEHITYTNPRRVGENAKFNGDYDPKKQRTFHKGHGQVTPIRVNYSDSEGALKFEPIVPGSDTGIQTKGMGRFYTLVEMGVQVICCAKGGGPGGGSQPYSEGVHQYDLGEIEPQSDERQFSNFPPLNADVQIRPQNGMPIDQSTWPNWLKQLQTTDPGIVQQALEPVNWNWQLAWLDPTYEGNMPGGKNAIWGGGPQFQAPSTILADSGDNYTRLAPNEKLLQASLVFNMFSPSLGWIPISPDMLIDIQIDGMSFVNEGATLGPVRFGWGEGNGVDLSAPLDPDQPGDLAWASCRISRMGEDRGWSGGDRTYGGIKPVPFFMRTSSWNENTENPAAQAGRASPVDRRWADAPQYRRYPYVTKPWKVSSPAYTMEEGYVRLNIFAAGGETEVNGDDETEGTAAQVDEHQLVQQLELFFPELNNVPTPELARGHRGYINEFDRVGHWRWQAMGMWSLSQDGANPVAEPFDKADGTSVESPNPRHPGHPWNKSMGRDGSRTGRLGRVWHLNNVFRSVDAVQSVGVRHADGRLIAARPTIWQSDGLFTPHHYYNNQISLSDQDGVLDIDGGVINDEQFEREVAANRQVMNAGRMAHNFASSPGTRAPGASRHPEYDLIPSENEGGPEKFNYHRNRRPYPMSSDTHSQAQRYGDFDNGMGITIDGSYINKPDEGNTHSLYLRFEPHLDDIAMFDLARNYGPYPYFVRDYMHEAGTPAYFSPNRIISSPGMFGSLPVGTTLPWSSGSDPQIGQPWRTMLFRPQVTGTGSGGLYDPHPGAGLETAVEGSGSPPDHYFLDLFWMPVVEPWVISEPLATAGKVNLNYQILPYTNIKRNTALRGVFKSEYMLCIPNKWADDAKIGVGRGGGVERGNYHWKRKPLGGDLQYRSLRSIILESPTLQQFQDRFDEYKIFKTASEFCEIHLIPQELHDRVQISASATSIGSWDPPPTPEKMESGEYWAKHAMVGDNGRERPYSNIYPRLTTKSNTFKVHFRAQVVKQASPPERDFSRWDETLDTMVAEYRGSTIVERYVEPNAEDIPDYTLIKDDTDDEITLTTIDEYYKFRVVNPTRFAP